ncbi:bifunctional endoribonuclease/protein kinase ire1 [Batrachochytrium dendrobatidis]|nr:bifunctional endoribonuclease/protein kinase ire1 [Batrachochytrium dendrobatidis]
MPDSNTTAGCTWTSIATKPTGIFQTLMQVSKGLGLNIGNHDVNTDNPSSPIILESTSSTSTPSTPSSPPQGTALTSWARQDLPNFITNNSNFMSAVKGVISKRRSNSDASSKRSSIVSDTSSERNSTSSDACSQRSRCSLNSHFCNSQHCPAHYSTMTQQTTSTIATNTHPLTSSSFSGNTPGAYPAGIDGDVLTRTSTPSTNSQAAVPATAITEPFQIAEIELHNAAQQLADIELDVKLAEHRLAFESAKDNPGTALLEVVEALDQATVSRSLAQEVVREAIEQLKLLKDRHAVSTISSAPVTPISIAHTSNEFHQPHPHSNIHPSLYPGHHSPDHPPHHHPHHRPHHRPHHPPHHHPPHHHPPHHPPHHHPPHHRPHHHPQPLQQQLARRVSNHTNHTLPTKPIHKPASVNSAPSALNAYLTHENHRKHAKSRERHHDEKYHEDDGWLRQRKDVGHFVGHGSTSVNAKPDVADSFETTNSVGLQQARVLSNQSATQHSEQSEQSSSVTTNQQPLPTMNQSSNNLAFIAIPAISEPSAPPSIHKSLPVPPTPPPVPALHVESTSSTSPSTSWNLSLDQFSYGEKLSKMSPTQIAAAGLRIARALGMKLPGLPTDEAMTYLQSITDSMTSTTTTSLASPPVQSKHSLPQPLSISMPVDSCVTPISNSSSYTFSELTNLFFLESSGPKVHSASSKDTLNSGDIVVSDAATLQTLESVKSSSDTLLRNPSNQESDLHHIPECSTVKELIDQTDTIQVEKIVKPTVEKLEESDLKSFSSVKSNSPVLPIDSSVQINLYQSIPGENCVDRVSESSSLQSYGSNSSLKASSQDTTDCAVSSLDADSPVHVASQLTCKELIAINVESRIGIVSDNKSKAIIKHTHNTEAVHQADQNDTNLIDLTMISTDIAGYQISLDRLAEKTNVGVFQDFLENVPSSITCTIPTICTTDIDAQYINSTSEACKDSVQLDTSTILENQANRDSIHSPLSTSFTMPSLKPIPVDSTEKSLTFSVLHDDQTINNESDVHAIVPKKSAAEFEKNTFDQSTHGNPTIPISATSSSSSLVGSQKLTLTSQILGYGSHGTIVYKGYFEGREVAIKRLLLDFFQVADHEVKILQETDRHPNVIRYYIQEQCDGFLYIALELCPASLFDIIEKPAAPALAAIREQLAVKDVLYQIMDGIQHLHLMRIVHRDLKPQNILIGGPKNKKDLKPRILISDFGLGKRLADDQSSFHNTAGFGGGTVGWRAPECLLEISRYVPPTHGDGDNETSHSSFGDKSLDGSTDVASVSTVSQIRITRSVDIFACGCIYYYVLTGGKHPFGEKFLREVNVLRGNYRLDGLDTINDGVLAKDLIKRMIGKDPRKRPEAHEVMRHPYFWTPSERLLFLQDISDRLEVEKRDPISPLLKFFERGGAKVTGGDWTTKLDKIVHESLVQHRTYDGASVQDLLRAIRNKKHHYQDLSAPVRKLVGVLPGPFWSYFESRLPHLLLHCYSCVGASKILKKSSTLKVYFEPLLLV